MLDIGLCALRMLVRLLMLRIFVFIVCRLHAGSCSGASNLNTFPPFVYACPFLVGLFEQVLRCKDYARAPISMMFFLWWISWPDDWCFCHLVSCILVEFCLIPVVEIEITISYVTSIFIFSQL
ncbi:hypothetical protein BDV30DRAFT_138862 [Aspergillus minisclerotigenes]|uniref:Uncharacterized protein n=1 Tax=Aspergillus minisclerotigenes TaxID=656917 RepID=A0A5N6IYV6_9EURO|nr:hypothetical protein BDV30DRAFT_138862 [Aspergillus minisclerotigenes]